MLTVDQRSVIGFLLNAKDSPPADKFIEDEELLTIGGSTLKVLHTPGHSPGSISLLGDGMIFSGDTLFQMGVGRTDLPGGSWEELENSVREKVYQVSKLARKLPR